MKRLQEGDECYIRIGGVILRTYWDSVVAHYLKNNRNSARLVYPYPIIKQLAK